MMEQEQTIAFCGGTLIDGHGAAPVLDSALVVQGSRILAVGPKKGIQLPDGCQIVDVTGRTLMPGMIDCHCHFAELSQDFQTNLFTPRTVRTFQAAAMLKKILQAGFTTVREAGILNDIGLRTAEQKGLLESPRLVMAGGIGQVGGHFDEYYPSGQQLSLYNVEMCPGGVEAARVSARKVLREGYDFIKVCATGGVVSSADEPDFTEWSPEELDVFVYEARARNRAVMAHCVGTQGTKNAIRAGIWSVEHGVMLDDEAVGLMVERGTFLVPTLFILHEIHDHGKEMGLTPVSLDKANHLLERHIASFQSALAAGVKIATGTDGIIESHHGRNSVELELMVKYGMSPLQAIGAATHTAAQVCRVDPLTGTLEVGKQADLLVVDGSPLDDIRILQDPARMLMVMKAGQFHVDKLRRSE
jgi:imidazolonepropionase-like amidohydrolase